MTTDQIKIMEIATRLVDYDHVSGMVTWKKRDGDSGPIKAWNSRCSGKQCGSVNTYGHIRIDIKNSGERLRIYAHRLAFFMFHGRLPQGDIDHINGNPADNRIENLRDVPHSVNLRNRFMQSNNTSGITGVSWFKRKSKWRAGAKINGKIFHLGYFHDKNEAHQAVLDFRLNNGFTDRHGKDRNPSA